MYLCAVAKSIHMTLQDKNDLKYYDPLRVSNLARGSAWPLFPADTARIDH
jgi:hypothetical protein